MNKTVQPTKDVLDQLTAMSADDRMLWLREQPAPEKALLQLSDEASKLAISEADRAVERTDVVIQLSDASGLALPRCRARRAAIRALSYNGRYDEAMRTAEECTNIAEAAGIVEESGRARLAQMHPLVESGRLREALAAGESARQIFSSAGLTDMAARADINLGAVHQKADEPARAVECLNRAREILKNEPLMIGHLENNRGEALLALNDFAGAEEAFSAALESFEREGVHLTAAIAAGNLADLAVRQGRLARAMRYFERARRELKAGGSPTHLARVVAEQAEAQALLGMNDAALNQFEEALAELDRSGCALEAARARSGMGLALMRAAKLTDAETALAAAAVGYEQLQNRTARAKVDLARAEILLSHGHVRESRRLALASFSALDERPADAIAARHLIARIELASGRFDEACAEFDSAVASARRFSIAPLLSDLLESRGMLHRARGEKDKAINDLREAVENVERIRGSLQAQRFRTAFLGQRASLHEELVDVLLSENEQQFAEEAFAVAERCKSRALLDRLSEEEVAGRTLETTADNSDAAAMHSELINRRFELNALYSRLADGAVDLSNENALTNWRTSMRRLEQRSADLENRLASTGHGGVYACSVNVAEVQRSLKSGEVLIEYFMVNGAISAFVVDQQSVRAMHRLARIEDIKTLLEQFRFQVNRALRPGSAESNRYLAMIAATQSALHKLNESLIAPLMDSATGANCVIFVPHGLLHAIPFHALFNGNKYLIERMEVVTAPSASIFTQMRSRKKYESNSGGSLVVGVDDDIAPGMADEARAIANNSNDAETTVLIGDDATAENVLRLLANASQAHIACHGVFLSDARDGAGLRLRDRWVTAMEIASRRTNAEVIVLSGCETGLSAVNHGDELSGLSAAFLASGARSVLVSLWRVDDATAVEFMHTLNLSRGTKSGKPRAALIREAQIEFMKRHPHPAHWGPFILTGES